MGLAVKGMETLEKVSNKQGNVILSIPELSGLGQALNQTRSTKPKDGEGGDK